MGLTRTLARQGLARPRTVEHYGLIARTVREVILEHWRADSCILSTRIGGAVLAQLHIPSRPLTVELVAINQAFLDRYRVMRRWPNGFETTDPEWYAGGEWSIGVGQRKGDGERIPTDLAGHKGWAGHLVSIVYGRIMVDWSIDQANRPEHGIVVTAMAGEVDAGFLSGKLPAVATAEGHGAIRYQARPADTSYRQSPAWRRRTSEIAGLDLVIAAAVARVRLALADVEV